MLIIKSGLWRCEWYANVGPISCVWKNRSGSRTDAPSGRRGRRLPMSSAPRERCFPHTACSSSPPRQPWRTACVPSMPTIRVGPRGCPGCPSCSSRHRLVASPACRSPCHSAASDPDPPTQWAFPTACPPTAPGCSPTSTRRIFQECRPLFRDPTTGAPRSCVAPRTVICGEGQASRLFDARRWSTQFP